ncbi:MAG: hypothetical protein GEU92_11380 [Alphaproteobacteria bacterium]|nr:hypothetical protein [Alphaproteobacteria bacterium]
MVSIRSFAAAEAQTSAALAALARQLSDAGGDGHFVYAFYGCDHDGAALLDFLKQRFPDAALLGGTSCSGVMSGGRLWGAESIGLLVIDDAVGEYGVASAELGDDPAATAQETLRAALENAGCPGELPELVWVFQAPGREEEVIDGMRRVVGDRCPIIGGSAADNSVAGDWRQIGPDGVLSNGLVVGVLFPSGGVGCSFQGGYEPAGPSGVVTRVGFDPAGDSGVVTQSSGRMIRTIDGRPAAEVYNGWIGDRLNGQMAHGGNILLETTMCPLAVDAGQVDGVPHYLLIHPESVGPQGELNTFASIAEGTRIFSMRGDKERLIERAGRVALEAVSSLPGAPESLAGGLMVYCAGCMLAVDSRMPEVASKVAEAFSDKPFLGCFTFGEQGCMVERNVHGNLMISAIAFGR